MRWPWAGRRVVPGENWYRDLLLLIGLAVMVAALIAASEANDTSNRAIRDVQEGRRTAITITCAAVSAVVVAGRDVITGPPHQHETPFTRALERIGYPPLRTRQAQSQHAAELYGREIVSRIDHELAQAGRRPVPGLVRSDGTLNCEALLRVSAVSGTR